MPKIPDSVLKSYFTQGQSNLNLIYTNGLPAFQNMNNTNRHPVFMETVLQYYPLKIHANGEFPQAMIEQRRPSESVEILEYRMNTYKPITKSPISKVINSLGKIRRSQDWTINWAPANPPSILPDETLEQYLTKHLPGFGNITDWAFNILLKNQVIDANAIVAVLPLDKAGSDEYYKPVPIVFNSDHVLEYDEIRKFAILKSRRKINYLLQDGTLNYNAGNRFYYVDDQEIVIYDESKDGFTPVFQLQHTLEEMPAFKVKGEPYKQYDNMYVNKSRLDAMVPFLDEAACEYSDLKGSKIQHLYPLFWYYQSKECNKCNGTGQVATTAGTIDCSTCSGTGKIKFSPFAHIQVEPPALGAAAVPSPPAGYIQRDTNILDMQDKSVDKNLFKALSAVNMQFLDQTPLNISGQAKSVDREELQNFVYNIAEDLIATMDQTIRFINDWRYKGIIPDKKKREELLPQIPVPMNFDLLPVDYLMNEITSARKNNVNPFLLATLEQQLAAKKFYNDEELGERIQLYFDLDPLAGMTIDEKVTLKGNNGITEEDFVISCYMSQFIHRALKEDQNFIDKKYAQQMEVLQKYAQEKIKVNDVAGQMIDTVKQKALAEMAAQNGGGPGGPSVPGGQTNPLNNGQTNPDLINPNTPAGIPKIPVSTTGNKIG